MNRLKKINPKELIGRDSPRRCQPNHEQQCCRLVPMTQQMYSSYRVDPKGLTSRDRSLVTRCVASEGQPLWVSVAFYSVVSERWLPPGSPARHKESSRLHIQGAQRSAWCRPQADKEASSLTLKNPIKDWLHVYPVILGIFEVALTVISGRGRRSS